MYKEVHTNTNTVFEREWLLVGTRKPGG